MQAYNVAIAFRYGTGKPRQVIYRMDIGLPATVGSRFFAVLESVTPVFKSARMAN
jgi:hypothetical protein